MKTTDLMKGDLLTFRDCQHDSTPVIFEIKEIRESALVVQFNDEQGYDIIDFADETELDEVVGIPLTKEILIKNGWLEESDYENDLYEGHFPEDKKHRLELDIDGSEVWWTINNVEYYIIPLHYVHELQHALKLCGIEKAITL